MKKSLSVILSLSLVTGLLSGCVSENKPNTENISSQSQTVENEKNEIDYIESLSEEDAMKYLFHEYVEPAIWIVPFGEEHPLDKYDVTRFFYTTEVMPNIEYYKETHEYNENEHLVYIPEEEVDNFAAEKFGVPKGFCKDETFDENKKRYKVSSDPGIGCIFSAEILDFDIEDDVIEIKCTFTAPEQPLKNIFKMVVDKNGKYISCEADKDELLDFSVRLTEIITLALDENTTPENPQFNTAEIMVRLATEENRDYPYSPMKEYIDQSYNLVLPVWAVNLVKTQILGEEIDENDNIDVSEETLTIPTEIGWGMQSYYAENVNCEFNGDKTQIITTFEMFAPDSSGGDPDEVSIGNYKAIFDVLNDYEMTYLRFNHYEKA